MGRFDRYMLSQLLVIFGFSSVVLVLIYWINRAVKLFDWLLASGQSATVFLEFTALTLPNVIRLVLPISAFLAAVYTTNRLASESELVVVQATGFGPFRLARPVLVFGLLIALFVALLVHFAVPASHARLADRQVEVAENVTARLLVEGRFVHPADGVTLYIREISGAGVLLDLFVRDAREPERPVVYTATRAALVRTGTGPRLVMYDGMAQALTRADRSLSVTRFSEFAMGVGSLMDRDTGPERRSYREASTAELLRAEPSLARALGMTPDRMRTEGHLRFSQSLVVVATPLLGFATLLLGGFSRFGLRNQIVLGVALVLGLYFTDNWVADMALGRPGAWPLVYIPGLVGILLGYVVLWIAANSHLLARRREVAS